jgi:hypothetical protein
VWRVQGGVNYVRDSETIRQALALQQRELDLIARGVLPDRAHFVARQMVEREDINGKAVNGKAVNGNLNRARAAQRR